MARRTANREMQMRKLVLRMQTVLDMRLQLRDAPYSVPVAWFDVQWRIAGMRIVAEMRQVEGSVTAA